MHTIINTISYSRKFDETLLYEVDYSIDQQHIFSDVGNILLYEKEAYYSILEKISQFPISQFLILNKFQ